ncbi:hypothetical protein [Clostridium sp. MD294]|uniref:hypothetical protein n=1 Tax=Clostridium sp. MD294 TaxID=97138 RepID=UPI0002C93D4F|nr:hypothetical protein [Clostridium sp. MD294]NDO46692.1 hypothetical protein [Clostridium sp. MD294]USF28872.1 hypothetical protein C820_000246 [Clostridium sp. MD294]
MTKSTKTKLKLLAIAILIMTITILSSLPMPFKYFLLFIVTVMSEMDRFPKYVTEIKQTKQIADKKKLILDIFSILIWFWVISSVLRQDIITVLPPPN